MNLRADILNYSYKNKCGHIASAFSMVDYCEVLFTNKIVTRDDYIVLGKPFGSQAYYTLWKEIGWLGSIDNLNAGVKHDEIPFVYFSEETMGNALGVAGGIALATDKKIWVNLSDASLQMGNTLEAIQFIGHNKLSNIFVTIDYNNAQVTGSILNILSVEPVIDFFKNNGWCLYQVDGHDKSLLSDTFQKLDYQSPTVIICHTKKGYGVDIIENDIQKWHYNKIADEEELLLLLDKLQ